MGKPIRPKKLGIGSLSLPLSITAIIWSCNIRWLNNFCLGDTILGFIGIPSWSNGAINTHYTLFYGFIFLIPAFVLGIRKQNDLFAIMGRRVAGFLMLLLGAMCFFLV